jgi:glycosyltransferase involved in cell wall biosynthesis
MARRVLILSYHFYPDAAIGARRISELAIALRQAGDEVTVIRGALGRDIHADPDLAHAADGLKVLRVPVPPKLAPVYGRLRRRLRGRWDRLFGAPAGPTRADAGAAARPEAPGPGRFRRAYYSVESIVDYCKLWAAGVGVCVLWRAPFARFDVVIASGPPWSVYLPATLAGAVFRAPLVIDLRDPWYGNLIWTAVHRSWLKDRVEAALERRCFSRAARVVCTSDGAARQVRERYGWDDARVPIIYNGYEPAPGGPNGAGAARPSARLHMVYSGTLYMNRDPSSLLEGIAGLVARPDVDRGRVRLTLVGTPSWGELDINAWAEARGLSDCIEAVGWLSTNAAAARVREADVLVNLAQGQPDQIPAKTFEYMASGRETVALTEADSDTANLLRRTGTGRVLDPADPKGVAEALWDLYRRYVVEGEPYRPDWSVIREYSRSAQNERYRALIDAVCAGEADGAHGAAPENERHAPGP